MLARHRISILLASLLLAGQAGYLFGQIGRATITGVVSDATGAVVPGVAVTGTNVNTGVKYTTTTNDVGNYTLASLPVGEYSISFSAGGFKEFTRSGLSVVSGQVARIDAALEVGQVAEKLNVTGEAPLLQTETSQASKSVENDIFKNLPLTFGAEGRNMVEFASKLVPGVNRSRWDMSIEGTPAASGSIIIDGMNNLAGYLPGDFAEDSISPEAVEEMTVFTGNVTAEFGHTGGGAVNFVLKSGTNQLHGSGMYYLRNEILNANDWNNNRMLAADPNFQNAQTRNFVRPMHRRKDFGFSVGGPVFLPKIYDGKDKTFFHVTVERFKRHESGPTTLQRNAPQPQFFDGDLSRLITGRQVGTDVLGRPVMEGQLYDPATLRQVNGQFVADPFLGNIIPKSRISQVARNFQPIFSEYYPPVTGDLTNNLYFTRFYDQTITQITAKGDHSFSPKHKVSGFFYKNSLPRLMEDSGGMWSLKDPDLGGPLAIALKQFRRANSWNVGHDWMVSATMLNHASFGINTNWQGNYGRQNTQGQAEKWGVKGVGLGLPTEKVTSPVFNMGSSPVVTMDSWGVNRNADQLYRSYVLSDTLSWQTHAHSLKFGFEYTKFRGVDYTFSNTGGTFNFASRTTGIPGQSYSAQTGNSFASFLLGMVDSANITPIFNVGVTRSYAALFVQDAWKVSRNLTLNLGLRWSGNSPIYEDQDRIASFNPALPDPNAAGMLGAVEYMGSGSGRSGRRSPANGDWKDYGPTFGFAYKVTSKTVLRGAYGITFTPESFATASGWGFLPFTAGFKPVNSVEANSKGIYKPVFNIDDGYPGQTQAPNLDPSWGQKRSSTIWSPDYPKAGYVQHFNFGVQLEPRRDLLVEAEWRGSKGTRLHQGAAGGGELYKPNQIRPEYLSKGSVLGQIIDSPDRAAAAGLPYPYAGWSGLGANTLMPFPQVNTQNLTSKADPVGFSNYQSANLIVTKRMSKGLSLYGAYIFSKLISNVRDLLDWYTVPIQDTYNRTMDKQISADDRTHVIKASLMWDLPFGKGKPLAANANRFVNAIIGNWSVSSILGYSSGAPLGVPNSRTTPVGWNGRTPFANFTPPAGGFSRVFNPDTFNPWNANDPGNRYFDKSAFSDALPQQLGNSPAAFPQVRGLWNWNEDAAILKVFPIQERVRLQVRAELLNAFNRHYFGGVDMNLNNSYFGNVRTASGGRTGQFGMRLEW